jgi:hypothetical protein
MDDSDAIKSLLDQLTSAATDARTDWDRGQLDLTRSDAGRILTTASSLARLPKMRALEKAYYGGLWVVRNSGQHMVELLTYGHPDKSAVEAALTFLESGIEQLIRDISEDLERPPDKPTS